MATLVYSDVDGTDRSFSLGAEPILVGRSAECAIRSDDPRVSRQHARFYLEHGALWVEDLGSSNGIYVVPHLVQRAPVPTGEIVLVGSLMIRLLPARGTLPPPIGLHGTLAQWLEMERKARSAVEEARNAFVDRVGQLFEEMKALRDANAAHEQEASELRAELERIQRQRSADLEHAAAKEHIAQLEARVAAGPVSHKLDAAEARAAKLAGELAEMTQQFEARRDRVSELERDLADAREAKGASSEAEKKIQATLAEAQAKARSELAAAQTRIGELAARLRTAASAEAENAAAKKAREDA